MIQEQFFPAFQLFDPEEKHFYQKNNLKEFAYAYWIRQRICFRM